MTHEISPSENQVKRALAAEYAVVCEAAHRASIDKHAANSAGNDAHYRWQHRRYVDFHSEAKFLKLLIATVDGRAASDADVRLIERPNYDILMQLAALYHKGYVSLAAWHDARKRYLWWLSDMYRYDDGIPLYREDESSFTTFPQFLFWRTIPRASAKAST